MKKTIRIMIAVVLMSVFISGLSAHGATIWQAVSTTSWQGVNRIETARAWFNPSIRTNTTRYGLLLNRNVRQSHVRLREGNRDTGRVYSNRAANTTQNKTITARTDLNNNLLRVMTFNWGWIYF